MMKELQSFLIALSTFTILPVPSFQWEEEPFRRVPRQLPLVGAVIGGLWLLEVWLLSLTALHPALKGAALAFFPWIITGFLHLDGMMDVADAMLSWREREERLRILKDPCCGPFGVASLGLVLIFTFAGGWALAEQGTRWGFFLAVPVLSRAMAALGMELLPSLSNKGMKAGMAPQVHRPTVAAAAIWAAAAAGFLLWNAGGRGGMVILLEAGIFWIICRRCQKTLGGVNGDVLGCAITLCELAALLAAVC